MTKLPSLTGLLLLSLTACGSAGDGADGNVANSAAANAAAPANAAEAEDHGHVEDGPRLLLTGTGLLADGSDESEIRFGVARSEVMAAVRRTLGQERGLETVEDCGGSGAAQQADWGPLVLFFQEDRFVGWEQRDRSETPWIGTPGGVEVGSRRPDLEAALGGAPTVEQSSLGTEFNREGISGLLASERADAQVDRLWAGNSCAMR